MSKKLDALRVLVAGMSLTLISGTLAGCSTSKNMYQNSNEMTEISNESNYYEIEEDEEDEETLYVKDNTTGSWIPYHMFMSNMHNSGFTNKGLNYSVFDYATKNKSGEYVSYTPTQTEITAMQNGNHVGRKGNAYPKSDLGTSKSSVAGGVVAGSTLVKNSSSKSSSSKTTKGSSKPKSSISKSSTKGSSSGKTHSFGGSSTRVGGGKSISIGG